MTWIFRDGYTIERENGEKITLTGKEVAEVNAAIDAENGRGSIEYFLESYDILDEDDEKIIKSAEKMIEDEDYCRYVWEEYMDSISYDTGYLEFDAVMSTLRDYMKKEGDYND